MSAFLLGLINSNYLQEATRGLIGEKTATLSLSGSSGFEMGILGRLFPSPINVPADVLWLFFWLAVAAFATMSMIFFYHWRNFELDKIKIRLMTLVYFFGGLAILLGIFNAILVYIRPV